MTENELRAKVVREAAGWLGVKEGTVRHRAMVDFYNAITPLPVGYKLKETDPWCASLVSVVGSAMHLSGIIYPECSCPRMVELYQRAGRWEEADDFVPSAGDLAFYGWQDSGLGDYQGPPDHVGIVQSVNEGMISVIEGNRNNEVSVRRIPVNARFIRGFGRPDYAKAAAELTAERSTSFSDVPAGAWYEQAVKRVAQAGILTGYPDGTFKPSQPLTRAEAAALADRLMAREDKQ